MIMNKSIPILAMLIVTFLSAMGLTACNKEGSSTSLAGTTWTATETTHGSVYHYTLTFGKSTFSMQFTAPTGSEGGTETETYTGTYTFDNPVVIMTAVIDGNNTTLNGVRDGNKLTLNSSQVTLTFTKK